MYARYIPPSKGSKPPKEPISTAAPPPAEVPRDGFSYSRFVPGAKPVTKTVETPAIVHFDDDSSPPTPKRKRNEAELPDEQRQRGNKKSKKQLPEDVNGADEAHKHDAKPELAQEETPESLKKSKKEKKRKDKEATATDTADEPGSKSRSANPEETKPKSSKKKDKKKRTKKEDEGADSEQENEDVSMVDADPPAVNGDDSVLPTVTETTAQKKRDKKKKTKDPVPAQEEPEEEKNDARHKAVLERKVKSLKLATEAAQDLADTTAEEEEELHGLEPLPQPAPAVADTSKPSYETLPSWMAAPIRVSQDTRTPFTELGLIPKAARTLEEKGFKDAFAVQTAALPLLLPSNKDRAGDLLISAATGSGKTLAYALPIVRDISQGLVTRLRALVVLPTRELVKQAQEVFELCAKAYEGGERKRVRIGIAIGSQMLRHEQEHLMESETRYDPDTYKKLQDQSRAKGSAEDLAEVDIDAEETDPRLGAWEGEVVDFMSKVDILICTPGRLVEHVEQTPGFSLDYVRWLVVDEADKLLAQSFQGWLDVVLEKFQSDKFSARDFPDMDYSGVRKVILSATLTRDLSLLGQLGLRRPQLIVLEGDSDIQVAEHSLPGLLKEFAIRVHDNNLKPLYLLELLQGQHMALQAPKDMAEIPKKTDVSDADSSSDTSSDTSSDSDATSSSGSDSGSDSDSDSDSDSISDSESESKPVRASRASQLPVALIFTKSNESALRLSRLLTLMDKSLSKQISTLTSTTPTHVRRKTLREFTAPSSPVRLIIASDLVARGIDIPKLDHVINYDLPPSVTGYVHRVGRTARAGRAGCAWTLVGDDESGWFWGKIAKGAIVRRSQKVERTRIEEMNEERVQEYEAALEELGREAVESRKR